MKSITEFLYNKHVKNVSGNTVIGILKEFISECRLSLPNDSNNYTNENFYGGKLIKFDTKIPLGTFNQCTSLAIKHRADDNISVIINTNILITIKDKVNKDLWIMIENDDTNINNIRFIISNEIYSKLIKNENNN